MLFPKLTGQIYELFFNSQNLSQKIKERKRKIRKEKKKKRSKKKKKRKEKINYIFVYTTYILTYT